MCSFVCNMAGSSKTIEHFWKDEETTVMHALLKELNILKCIDGRKTRNGNLIKRVSEQMREGIFVRTAEQIRIRWNLKKKNVL